MHQPQSSYTIVKDQIVPMTGLIQESLDEIMHAQVFLERHYVRLNANYVYTFFITKDRVQWKYM
jgi:hypothetical protein